jgi:hypothetical protein
MVLNKLKSRSIKRGKRAKHGKYTKRKGRVHVYHQKYKKHYTRKYGKRIQRRRRSKKGGELTLNIPNMNTPVTILYRYFARITKPDVDSFSEDICSIFVKDLYGDIVEYNTEQQKLSRSYTQVLSKIKIKK